MTSIATSIDLTVDDTTDVVTRLDKLAREPFTPERYLEFFIDYIKPTAYRWRLWMLTDAKLRDAAKTLDFDDLVQIGSVIVWRLTNEITEHIDDVDPYVFSAWLKVRIEGAYRDAIKSARVKSTQSLPDEEDDPTIRTSIRVRDSSSMMLRDIAELMADIPTVQRMMLGMFIVEEMRQQDIAEIAGVGQATVSRWIKDAAGRSLIYAQNQVLTYPEDPDAWPASSNGMIAAVSNVSAWVRERYGVDFTTWLNWITDAYSTEPGYIVDVLGIAYGHMVHRQPEQYELEDDIAQLRLLDPPPSTVRDVASRTGMSYTRAMKVLRVWRHRHSS